MAARTDGPPRLIGLPFDASSSFMRGAAGAPARVREALFSKAGNLFTEELVDLGGSAGLGDAGDLELGGLGAGTAFARIEAALGALLDQGYRPIALGGDHAVTLPVARALRRAFGPFAILHLDAHPDLYDQFEGDRWSHASPFARVLEEGLATRLVQVGIRAANPQQARQAERSGVETIPMRAFAGGRRPDVRGPLFVSIDLDALDPAFAPGVSHREPGGLSVRDVVSMIQDVEGPLLGADVVEFNPLQDRTGVTAQVAAKLVKELAGRMLARSQATGGGGR